MTTPRSKVFRTAVGALLALVCLLVSGCGVTSPPKPRLPASSPTTLPRTSQPSAPVQLVTGRELDRRLRDGRESPPFKLGRLLVATESGRSAKIPVDLSGLRGEIAIIFRCAGPSGVEATIKQGDDTIMWLKTDGCSPNYLYSGAKQINGKGAATLHITTSPNVAYALVVEAGRVG